MFWLSTKHTEQQVCLANFTALEMNPVEDGKPKLSRYSCNEPPDTAGPSHMAFELSIQR